MVMLRLLLALAQLPGATVQLNDLPAGQEFRLEDGTATMEWVCPEAIDLRLADGLTGFTADGCGFTGPQGEVLLPAARFFIPVPHGVEPTVTVEPSGVRTVGSLPVGAVTVIHPGVDSIHAADTALLPTGWGRISHSGSFRRVGTAVLELNPVTAGPSGELLAASSLKVTVTYPEGTGSSVSLRGWDGAVSALLEGDMGWRSARADRGQSPFLGLPWAAIHVDTAAVYGLCGGDLPEAVGQPSSTLSMFCGMGREMGEYPWNSVYQPRPVPIHVEDGGDGTFDAGDSLFFFGRGLSWWEPGTGSKPSHFGHRYSDQNVYWLTWGGEPGARMEILDGGLTGAPTLPDSFLARMHFEQNLFHTRSEEYYWISIPDDWAWDWSSGSSSQWLYYPFDSDGALDEGWIRVHMRSPNTGYHRVQFALNGTVQCDTSWKDSDDFTATFPVSGLKEEGNVLGVHIIRDGSKEMLFDWFEVFPWTGTGSPGQVQVPMEWWSGTGRHRFVWEAGLSGTDVYLLGGDTLAARITLEDTASFEFEPPPDTWPSRELWVVPSGATAVPDSIRFPAPGRILGGISGRRTLIVSAPQFVPDAELLTGNDPDTELLASSEIYDEFNGGVRDPQAIRALVSLAVDSWDPIPSDIVLVGGGTWDPRNFVSTRESFIDILYRNPTSYLVTDDRFSIVESDSVNPQVAMSRIGVGGASDLRLLVSKTLDYRSGIYRGDWQNMVLAAADDERSPLHGGDERFHTESMERVLTDHLPPVLRPEKLYLIFYDWNDFWKKPEARSDYISAWSRGALLSLYLGHGGYDQIADEGLLYLEDAGLLACEGRLPYALFGSCGVGEFMNPAQVCLGQAVTVSPAGGAIAALGATGLSSGLSNEYLMISIIQRLCGEDLSMGMCTMLGKLDTGYSGNSAMYVLFGDGSTQLAYPGSTFPADSDTMRTGEYSELHGTAPSEGLVLLEAFESCEQDTYFTFRQHLPLAYLSQARCFFRGSAPAGRDFSTEVFVPIDAATGNTSRTQFVFLDSWRLSAASTYPAPLLVGTPAHGDTAGPEIELWVQGYRNIENPSVTGSIGIRAVLSDPSGINLLGGTGRQLALYVDGTPQEVSEHFRYNQGSGTTGELTVDIGSLAMGEHTLELRASDGLLNRSTEEMDLTVVSESDIALSDAFAYPNPCSEGVSLNWTQSASGPVDLAVFTVCGRKILEVRNIQGMPGYNQHWWDCLDADGDPAASGSYIFQVSASAPGSRGESGSIRSIVALVRGST